MKRILIGFVLGLLVIGPYFSLAQETNGHIELKDQQLVLPKYPSLLWKISGKGLVKPSFLYGTMHVSNKLAFHLGDSFFLALNAADMVALESDPSTWMAEMLHNNEDLEFGLTPLFQDHTEDFYHSAFTITELTNNAISMCLASNPGMLNGIMHRSYDREDFEEETYLDMFIYQAGHRLKKGVTGLEDPKQVDALVKKAQEYNAADEDENDKNRRTIRKMEEEGKNIMEMLEDAYRRGDLDMLDSLQKLMNANKNYLKYMLYERNIHMAERMDSIIRLNKSLFSGIGAAHLAGENGVIELLRAKGYTLTPMIQKYGKISKSSKEKIENIRIPQVFKTQRSSDGAFEVFMPGVLYEFPEYDFYKEYFYPDLVNAAFYSIRRIRTYGPLSGYTPEQILEKTDSLLFENVPGKMMSKKSVIISGHQGFDIMCRLKKGDYQRYVILFSPIEIFIFRVGGPDNFVKGGDVQKFFKSIKINGSKGTEPWQTYTPDSKGFEVQMPAAAISDETDKRMRRLFGPDKTFQSFDASGDYFMVKRNGLHDMEYIEEDTFEMAMFSDNFYRKFNYNQMVSKEFSSFSGRFPALTSHQTNETGEEVWLKIIINGPMYYMLVAKTSDSAKALRFFSSFKFTPNTYFKPSEVQKDTSYFYEVDCTVKPPKPPRYSWEMMTVDDKKENNDHTGDLESIIFHNPGSDEQVEVVFDKQHKYYMVENADSFWIQEKRPFTEAGLVVGSIVNTVKDSIYTWTFRLTDTGSVRGIYKKYILKNRVCYKLSSVIDTNAGPSPWVLKFYESFTPADTAIGLSIFVNKADMFFEDLWSGDSSTRRQALLSVDWIKFEDRHVESIIKVIQFYQHELYTPSIEAGLVYQLGSLKSKAIIPFLQSYYPLMADTPIVQVNILQALGKQKSQAAIDLIRKLMAEDVPLLNNSGEIGFIFSSLDDSMNLAKSIFPAIMEYTRYPEYRPYIYDFLATLSDSGFLFSKDYLFYKKFLIRETKDELKRQIASDQSRNEGSYNSFFSANQTLLYLSKLLVPFYEDAEVKGIFSKLIKVENDFTRMQLALLMLHKKIPVHDSVWARMAKNDNSRLSLYNALKKIECHELIPSNLRDQIQMARAVLYTDNGDIDESDSVKFLAKFKVSVNTDSGYVYFFKRKKPYGNDEWLMDYVGLQPIDTNRFSTSSDIFGIAQSYDSFEEGDEQFLKIIDELRFRKRQRYTGDSATDNAYYDDY